jgi:hypothetical protein
MNAVEDYVPLIAAQILKEVGFNEPCKGVFMNGQCMLLSSLSYNSLFQYSDTCSAPTMQMALKWLREERNIFVEIRADRDAFSYTIKFLTLGVGWKEAPEQETKTYETFEEAACEGLIRGLKYTYYNGKEN